MIGMPPSANDFAAAFALLQIISTPEQSKTALEALAAKVDEFNKAREAANAALASSRAEAARAEALVRELGPKQEQLEAWEAQLKKRERECAERERRIAEVRTSWETVT
jgi:chromosome segregation ATPase